MLTCTTCGQVNPGGFRFCGACGAALPSAPAPPSSDGLEPEEERKVVTVLFCDLVGFTAQSDQADPEDVRDILRPYHLRLRTEIERLGGTLDKFIGDGIMAVFGIPAAHEDDPERAVRCALKMLDSMAELNASRPGRELAVRIGVTTGEALIALGAARAPRPATEAVIGDVVNTASRLQGVAPAGGVVIDEATFRATRTEFEFEELGPVRVKGKAGSIPIWRVIATRSRIGVDVGQRPETPMIGREAELDVLKHVFRRALGEHDAHLVTVAGEPGVGKTRLVQELFAYLDGLPDLIAWRQGRCLPYGDGITFWALGEIVKAQAGILESDDPGQVAEKLRAAVDAVVEDHVEREWLTARLAPLLGLPAGQVGAADRGELFAAWQRFVVAVAAGTPLILVVEDLHWADDAMLEFLRYLAERATGADLLLITTARPELYARAPGWGEGARATKVWLSPLPDDDTARLLGVLMGRPVLPAEVQAPLLERAGGNPLFAEELVRLLSERGMLVRERGAPRLTVSEIPFPATIQATIAARLDTLTHEHKSLLQDAAVIGRVFWPGALAAMGDRAEDRVAEGLAELHRRELIRPVRSSSVAGQAQYAFTHGLVREVAYAQMPRGAKARRHRAAAEWIESLAGDRLPDLAELLAHHYSQALALTRAARLSADRTEMAAKTRRFLLIAGRRLLDLDITKAGSHLTRVLQLSKAGHRDHAEALVLLAEAITEVGRPGEAVVLYEQAIAELRGLGDTKAAAGALIQYARLLRNRGQPARSREVADEAMKLLEGEPPGRELADAYLLAAFDEVIAGRAEAALDWAGRTLELAERLGLRTERAIALELRGSARNQLGELKGLDDLRAALRSSIDLGQASLTGRIANNLTEEQWPVEGPAAALETVAVGIDVSERRGLSWMAMWLRATALGPRMDLGEWDEVLRSAAELRTWARAEGVQPLWIWAAFREAKVLLLRGSRARAAELAAEFMPLARELGEAEALVPALTVAALVAQADGEDLRAVQLVAEVASATVGKVGWYCAHELPDLVRVASAVGDPELAEALTSRISLPGPRHRNGVITARAVVAEARGDVGEALALYADVAERWAAFGHVHERALALLGAGRCRARLGDGEAAGPLTEARELLAGLGATPAVAEAEAWLSRARARSG